AANCASLSCAWARCQPVIAVRAPAVMTMRVVNPPELLAESYPTPCARAGPLDAIAPVAQPWVIASAPSLAAQQCQLALRPMQPRVVPAPRRALRVRGSPPRRGVD